MDSFPKETHRYAFAMVKAARTMPIDMAEKYMKDAEEFLIGDGGIYELFVEHTLLFDELKYLLTIKKTKKVINAKIDKKLNSTESVCILSFYSFIIFFYNINT